MIGSKMHTDVDNKNIQHLVILVGALQDSGLTSFDAMLDVKQV